MVRDIKTFRIGIDDNFMNTGILKNIARISLIGVAVIVSLNALFSDQFDQNIQTVLNVLLGILLVTGVGSEIILRTKK